MAELAVSRKQRLRTLENQIRKNYEAFVATGFALKEIRDDGLYKEDGFATWESYLRERVGEQFGIERSQVFRLIACANIRPKLPDLPKSEASDLNGWTQSTLIEFGRLAPKDEDRPGHPPDYDALKKRDVERVAKKVIEHCEEKGEKPTATIVRKFVDEDLGIDRSAKAQETRREREDAAVPHLHQVLSGLQGRIEAVVEECGGLDEDVWTLLNKKHPGVTRRLVAACKALTDLLEG